MEASVAFLDFWRDRYTESLDGKRSKGSHLMKRKSLRNQVRILIDMEEDRGLLKIGERKGV